MSSSDLPSQVFRQQGSIRALVHAHSNSSAFKHGTRLKEAPIECREAEPLVDARMTNEAPVSNAVPPYNTHHQRKNYSNKHRRGSSGYTVTYDSSSHAQVLFQMWGSVWPKVLPYCIVNVCIAGTIQVLNSLETVDLTISDESHTFMSLLVAFLLVSRVTITVNRYMEARECLGIMDQQVRELLQHVSILTRGRDELRDKEWRSQVAYRTLLLFRAVIAVMDYGSDQIPAWDIPELDREERRQLKLNLSGPNLGARSVQSVRWMPVMHSALEESMRVPLVLVYQLRCCLDNGREQLSAPMDELRALKLFETVDKFMEGYYGIRKFLTTPFPFPMVQMARTFLFFYIFTVPFALLSDVSSPYAHLLVIFMMTYGFVGLELVAIELDDPFGNDANDFKNLAFFHTTCEDTYMLVTMVDGEEYTKKLRFSMRKTTHLNEAQDEEESGHNERTLLLGQKY